MNKRIAILLENQYQELEVWYPYYRMKEEGFDVHLIGTDKEVYKGKSGYPATADLGIKSANPENYDCCIVPGGFAPDFMRRTPEFIQFTRAIYNKEKVIAAICHGVWICASADILKGNIATCYFAIQDDIKNAGAEYVDKEVVVSGNLITSRKPEDLPPFCKEIIRKLRS